MQHKANRFNNKGKIVASLLLLALTTGAGSIAGTVAWYQYSTIASASYIATTAKASELLQISAGSSGEWKSTLATSDISAAKGDTGTSIVPVTAGNQEKNAVLNTLKSTPRYQYTNPDNWGDAPATSYLQFSLSFRVQDGENAALNQQASLYISDLAFRDDVLSDALRIHIHNATDGKDFLLARTNASIETHGNLDLNGDGSPDTAQKYEWDTDDTALDYGDSGTETAYLPSEMYPTDNAGALSGGISIGNIPAGGTLSLIFTIFVEGWEPLGGSAVWTPSTYAGKEFGVGLSFKIPKLV